MTALTTLASKLSQKELTKLAHTIVNDPVKRHWLKSISAFSCFHDLYFRNPYPMNSETTTHNHEGFTPKEIITYSLLGVVVLGGSFFIGRRLVRKVRSDSEEKKTYEEGNEATMAKQLKMAFDNDMWFGWGTDEEAIRKTLQAVPSKEVFRKGHQLLSKIICPQPDEGYAG